MLFWLNVRIGFVDGTNMDVALTSPVTATDEKNLLEIVTPEYIMKNETSHWGPPIQNVTIIKADPAV